MKDSWIPLSDASPTDDALVPFEHFQDDPQALRARPGRLGLLLGAGVDVRQLEGLLDGVELVCLRFERFADGRAYSQARLLREQLGFKGAIRATGDVLRDQLVMMRRCGFDEFAVRPDKDPHDALRAFKTFSVDYGGLQGLEVM